MRRLNDLEGDQAHCFIITISQVSNEQRLSLNVVAKETRMTMEMISAYWHLLYEYCVTRMLYVLEENLVAFMIT